MRTVFILFLLVISFQKAFQQSSDEVVSVTVIGEMAKTKLDVTTSRSYSKKHSFDNLDLIFSTDDEPILDLILILIL